MDRKSCCGFLDLKLQSYKDKYEIVPVLGTYILTSNTVTYICWSLFQKIM